MKLSKDFVSNGFANWDAGYKRLWTFALHNLADGTFGPQTCADIRTDIERIQAYARSEDIGGYDLKTAFDRLMPAAVGWCQRHPAPIPHSPDPELKQ